MPYLVKERMQNRALNLRQQIRIDDLQLRIYTFCRQFFPVRSQKCHCHAVITHPWAVEGCVANLISFVCGSLQGAQLLLGGFQL